MGDIQAAVAGRNHGDFELRMVYVLNIAQLDDEACNACLLGWTGWRIDVEPSREHLL